MKRALVFFGLTAAASTAFAQATTQPNPPAVSENTAVPEWSEWVTKRGHFQFQLRAEEAGPGVMRVRMRIRPDVERIAREPSYRNEIYYLEYSQAISPQYTGNMGDTSIQRPRRLKFPANAPASCVYEEENIFATNGTGSIFMDHSISPEPMQRIDDRLVSAFQSVLAFDGSHIGPGAVVRFSGVDLGSFKPVC